MRECSSEGARSVSGCSCRQRKPCPDRILRSAKLWGSRARTCRPFSALSQLGRKPNKLRFFGLSEEQIPASIPPAHTSKREWEVFYGKQQHLDRFPGRDPRH